MSTTITNSQIETLRTEAAAAGDAEQVSLCDRALDGDTDARQQCAEAIDDATAQDDAANPDHECPRCGRDTEADRVRHLEEGGPNQCSHCGRPLDDAPAGWMVANGYHVD